MSTEAGQFHVANRAGYRQALRFAQRHAPGRRVWALEGTGSYTAGLTRFLAAHGERVVEVDRPARAETAGHLKSDQLDAIRAARTALGRQRVPLQPRRGEQREALRVLLVTRRGAVDARQVALNQLKALLVTAPDGLRAPLRRLSRAQLLARCRALRPPRGQEIAAQATLMALRACARRIPQLTAEAREHERQIRALVAELAPQLLAQHGVGPICAAELLVAWSHPGRFPSEAHFARLAGVAPIPAGTGKHARLRLDPRGDRQLNRALHTILLARRRGHAPHRPTSSAAKPKAAPPATPSAASSATWPATSSASWSTPPPPLDEHRTIGARRPIVRTKYLEIRSFRPLLM